MSVEVDGTWRLTWEFIGSRSRSQEQKMCCMFCLGSKFWKHWLRTFVYVLLVSVCGIAMLSSYSKGPLWGRGAPLSPLSIYFLIFSPFHFSLSFIGFTYFLLLSISSLSTRIVPLRFQVGGRRRRSNLVLVCVLFCTLCYLFFLVKMYCGALFYLV